MSVFPAFLELSGRSVLTVGGGPVAASKIAALQESGAVIHVVTPEICPGIGLQGSVRKLGDRAVPQYFLMLGGSIGPQGVAFARLAAKIPARRIPSAIERLLRMYERERNDGESATAFFNRVDRGRAAAALADLESLAPEEARDEDFIDPGEEQAFVPEVQDGECSA